MAIDTAKKRLAALDMDVTTMPGMPFPDGAIDAGDRRHFLWLYTLGQTLFTLPDAATLTANGCRWVFEFLVSAGSGIRVMATGGNTIRIGANVSGSNGYVESGVVGNYVKLSAIDDDRVVATGLIASSAWTVT